jgi:hypothetical protein
MTSYIRPHLGTYFLFSENVKKTRFFCLTKSAPKAYDKEKS